jgi:uncharacterized protein YceK
MRIDASSEWPLLLATALLLLGGCGSAETATTTTAGVAPGSTVSTATGASASTEVANQAESTLTAAELVNSGTHTYSSGVEVLECGAQPPPSLSENRVFEVVVGADQMSYDNLNDDNPPLVWDRAGPNVFTREFTTDDGEHLAYTLTLDETGMVYYYDIDTVPCRRVTWTMIDR